MYLAQYNLRIVCVIVESVDGLQRVFFSRPSIYRTRACVFRSITSVTIRRAVTVHNRGKMGASKSRMLLNFDETVDYVSYAVTNTDDYAFTFHRILCEIFPSFVRITSSITKQTLKMFHTFSMRKHTFPILCLYVMLRPGWSGINLRLHTQVVIYVGRV